MAPTPQPAVAASVARTLARLGGVATTAELRASHTARELRSAVAAGLILRSARGRYASPLASEHRRAAHARKATLSHLSAALAHGWKVCFPPDRVWVTVPRNRRFRGTGDTLRVRWGELTDAEVRAGVTAPLRTVLDCARTLPFAEAVAVADSALRALAVSREDLVAASARLRGPGAGAARRVAAFADARAANPFESVLRAHCAQVPGLRLIPQLQIADTGIFNVVDLGDPRLALVLEAEGFEHHGSRSGLRRDCRRQTELAVLGYSVLRFSWEDVMLEPAWVIWALTSWLATRSGMPVAEPPARHT